MIPSRRGYAVTFVIAMLLMGGELASSWCAHAADSATANSPAQGFEGPERQAERNSKTEGAERVLTTLDSLSREVIEDAKFLLSSPLRMDKKSALLLGGVAAGIGGLMLVDSDIQKSFQENRNNTSNDLADSLETIGFSKNLLLGNIGLIGAGWWFREHKEGDKLFRTALVSLEAQLFVEGITGLTKFAVGRDRPSAGQGEHSYDPFHGFDTSFPSSHAARTFAFAAVFADRYEQPIPLLLYSTATIISLSRIHLNDHFASDVFAGAALGFAIGKALIWRHKDEDRRLTFLPFAPGLGSGVGITVQYSF